MRQAICDFAVNTSHHRQRAREWGTCPARRPAPPAFPYHQARAAANQRRRSATNTAGSGRRAGAKDFEAILLHTLRKDGFAYIESRGSWARFVSKPLVCLNAEEPPGLAAIVVHCSDVERQMSICLERFFLWEPSMQEIERIRFCQRHGRVADIGAAIVQCLGPWREQLEQTEDPAERNLLFSAAMASGIVHVQSLRLFLAMRKGPLPNATLNPCLVPPDEFQRYLQGTNVLLRTMEALRKYHENP